MTTTIETTTRTIERRPATVSSDAYDKLTESSYVHSMGIFSRTLTFTETGTARLAHTIGWLQGIHRFDPERAYALANDLWKYICYLGEYGGTEDSPEGRTHDDGTLLQFPRYKVILGDDGGLGSFSIAWYRLIPHSKVIALAEARAEANSQAIHGKTFAALSADESEAIWWGEAGALETTKRELKIRKELDDYKLFWPVWNTAKSGMMEREWVSYGYCHNGGLIFHHDREDDTKGHWSTHT